MNLGDNYFVSQGNTLNHESFQFQQTYHNVHSVGYFSNGSTTDNWVILSDVRVKTPATCTNSNAKPQTEEEQPDLVLSPNPFSTWAKIKHLQAGEHWQLFDLSGKLCQSGTGTELDGSELPAGLYLLRTSLGRTLKVIK